MITASVLIATIWLVAIVYMCRELSAQDRRALWYGLKLAGVYLLLIAAIVFSIQYLP